MSAACTNLKVYFAALLALILVLSGAFWAASRGLEHELEQATITSDQAGEIRHALAEMVALERGIVLQFVFGNPERVESYHRQFTARLTNVRAQLVRLSLLEPDEAGRYAEVLREATGEWWSAHVSILDLCGKGQIRACNDLLRERVVAIEQRADAASDCLAGLASESARDHADREIRKARILAAFVLGFGTLLTFMAFRLITERQRAQRHFRTMADSAPVMIWTAGADGEVDFVNRAWLEFTGRTLPDDTGQAWVDSIHPADREAQLEVQGTAFQARQPIRLEYRVHSAGGDYRWILAQGTPRFTEDNQFAGYIGSAVDITARKRAEQDLKTLNETLEQQVAERTAAKEALLKEVHHRVKNNLQLICSLLSLQARRIEDEQARRAFEESRMRVYSVAMVHEALFQSRDVARIDFAEYVRNLTRHLFTAYGAEQGRVALELDVEDTALSLDVAIPCALILSELAGNSLKHAFAHGERGALRVSFHRSDGFYLLETADTGKGAPAGAVSSKSFGLRLVSILAGQLDGVVETHPENGFRVTVKFPAVDCKPATGQKQEEEKVDSNA